jgi:hypothetical protein
VLIFLVNVAVACARGEPAPDDPGAPTRSSGPPSSPPPNYNFHPLPTVRASTRAGRRTADRPAGGDGLRPTGARCSSPTLDAEPDYRSVLPAPSYAPLLLALGATVAFIGVIYDEWIVPIGALLSFAAIVYWHWPRTAERTPPWKERNASMNGAPPSTSAPARTSCPAAAPRSGGAWCCCS